MAKCNVSSFITGIADCNNVAIYTVTFNWMNPAIGDLEMKSLKSCSECKRLASGYRNFKIKKI